MSKEFISKIFPDVDLSKIHVDSNEILLLEIDTGQIDVSTARDIYDHVEKRLPNATPLVCVPTGINLETKIIKEAIKFLEGLLDE